MSFVLSLDTVNLLDRNEGPVGGIMATHHKVFGVTCAELDVT